MEWPNTQIFIHLHVSSSSGLQAEECIHCHTESPRGLTHRVLAHDLGVQESSYCHAVPSSGRWQGVGVASLLFIYSI